MAEEQKSKKRKYRLSTINLLTMAAVAVVGAVFSSFVFPALMSVATPVFVFLGPIGWMGIMGVYLIWPVVIGLLICKPGAVVLFGVIMGFVEMLFGNPFGAMAIVYASVESLGVEIGMAIFRWKNKLISVIIGAGLGSLMIGEVYIFLFNLQSTYTIIVGGITAFISGAIFGGLGGWLIAQALYKTGVVTKIGLGYEEIK
jgi:energy-coupling factor transport system substrate-specific component